MIAARPMKPAQMTAKNPVIVGTANATAVRLLAAAGQIAASAGIKSVIQHAVRIEKPAHKIAPREITASEELKRNRPSWGGFLMRNGQGMIHITDSQ